MARKILLFLPFALCLCLSISSTATATSRGPVSGRGQGQVPIVHIINDLPRNSTDPLGFSCWSQSTVSTERVVASGDDYQWSPELSHELYICGGDWERFIAEWNAYQPRRDRGHAAVFWKVRGDGFYLSWDRSNWVRKAVWNTE